MNIGPVVLTLNADNEPEYAVGRQSNGLVIMQASLPARRLYLSGELWSAIQKHLTEHLSISSMRLWSGVKLRVPPV